MWTWTEAIQNENATLAMEEAARIVAKVEVPEHATYVKALSACASLRVSNHTTAAEALTAALSFAIHAEDFGAHLAECARANGGR